MRGPERIAALVFAGNDPACAVVQRSLSLVGDGTTCNPTALRFPGTLTPMTLKATCFETAGAQLAFLCGGLEGCQNCIGQEPAAPGSCVPILAGTTIAYHIRITCSSSEAAAPPPDLPQPFDPPPIGTQHLCIHEDFGPCSSSCGAGTSRSSGICVDSLTGDVVDAPQCAVSCTDHLRPCDSGSCVPSQQPCGSDSLPECPQWRAMNLCSDAYVRQACGMSCNTLCTLLNPPPATVAPTAPAPTGSPSKEASYYCNYTAGACSASCGQGVRSVVPVCTSSTGESVSPEMCGDLVNCVSTIEPCTGVMCITPAPLVAPAAAVSYSCHYSQGPCSTSGLGTYSLTAVCKSSLGFEVGSFLCGPSCESKNDICHIAACELFSRPPWPSFLKGNRRAA